MQRSEQKSAFWLDWPNGELKSERRLLKSEWASLRLSTGTTNGVYCIPLLRLFSGKSLKSEGWVIHMCSQPVSHICLRPAAVFPEHGAVWALVFGLSITHWLSESEAAPVLLSFLKMLSSLIASSLYPAHSPAVLPTLSRRIIHLWSLGTRITVIIITIYSF